MSGDATSCVKNIVLVGDGLTGKTTLLHSYSNKKFIESYEPTVFAKEDIAITLDGKEYFVKFHDTAGQEEYDMLRKFSYETANAFILCYSSTDRNSFENIAAKWISDLRQPATINVPIVLTSTKVDLRRTALPENRISTSEGENLKRKIGAVGFIECSAKEQVNVDEVIQMAVRASDGLLKAEPVGNNGSSFNFKCCF